MWRKGGKQHKLGYWDIGFRLSEGQKLAVQNNVSNIELTPSLQSFSLDMIALFEFRSWR